ncbi:hypothetical protein NQ317_015768 [Molorchus minor]|uniref:SLC26A/SulP transporter domain-containing protein n=1 Tax=Molorchus minor TaxID=1323400 RepID=A0ABQ9K3V3_9CUCU|nr:hypothetical protein NQ317_015768 [Molorchus minor]
MKYKLNGDDQRSGSQVTLTSYMVGENCDTNGNQNVEVAAEGERTETRIAVNSEQNGKCPGDECTGKNGTAVLDLPEENYLQHRHLTTYMVKPTMKEWIKERLKKGCRKKVLFKRIPIISWLPQYNLSFAISDFLAGLTVGLTVIPQAIAYASVAGLPPQVGLYSSFMACFVYALFGSCKDAPIGPTAISALMTRENDHGMGIPGAVLLTFLSGCVEFIMGVLQLGFLIDFISGPVSIGFTSAAAIIIATTQVKDILGLSYPGGKFLQVWEQIFEHISETRPWDALLGFTCMAVLLVLRKAKDFKIGPDDEKEKKAIHNFLSKLIWLISTARNIIVVIVSAFLAYFFEMHGQAPFKLTGFVKPGLPHLQSPPFTTQVGNHTYNFFRHGFYLRLCRYCCSSTVHPRKHRLGESLFSSSSSPLGGLWKHLVLPKFKRTLNYWGKEGQNTTTRSDHIELNPILEIINIFVAEGKSIDATQEMLALGICNIASSFVSSMPVSGALSRGAVNNASGVKTPFGGCTRE